MSNDQPNSGTDSDAGMMVVSDPKQLLKQIAERTERIETQTQREPRLLPDPHTEQFAVLEYIKENPGCNTEEISNAINANSVTRTAADLYQSYLVNRSETIPYEYTISALGEKAYAEVTQQQKLIKDADNSPNPWEKTDLRRSEYIVLHLIEDNDPRGAVFVVELPTIGSSNGDGHA